ncbi:hypothetical protein [Bartonella schoenbuchensis]|uniref:hypothetical protein n=1 Tax=Bartonella schoenbuchensis TaxID=165694 RepID=UPI001ABB8AC1|nr:hypothetical protein [Bartonella schoenbuchensis]
MDGVSEVELNKTEENLHKEQSVPKKKRKRNLFIRILLFFINKFLHFLFLFLLFLRTPIRAILNLLTAGSMLTLYFHFFGYIEGVEIGPTFKLVVFSSTIMMFFCLWASWGYDTLLLRLAPLDYDLVLFD